MNNYFNALLELLRQYVEVSINNRAEIAKINNNGDISQSRKERDINTLKEKALKLSEDCIKQADTIIKRLVAKLEEVNKESIIPDMQGVFAYLTASASKCDNDVLINLIKPYRGNLTAMRAILSVADNAGVGVASKRIIDSYIYDVETVKQSIDTDMKLVLTGSMSATEAGKNIQKEASILGIDVVSDIKDEYTDNQLLRKAFGLA